MPAESAPLMSQAELAKARALLWLLLTISALVLLAVAIETLGDVADRLAIGAHSSQKDLVISIVVAVVLLGLLLWLVVALLLELRAWNRVVAAPLAFTELVGEVATVRRALWLPQFLSTTVKLDRPWKGHDSIRLVTTNGASAGGGPRTGQLASVGERVRIQVYDGARRRRLAVAGTSDRPPRRANLLP